MTDRTKPRATNDSKIARLRMERCMTQSQLAEAVGCYPKDISRWETGERRPKIDALMRIAAALGTTLEDLISV